MMKVQVSRFSLAGDAIYLTPQSTRPGLTQAVRGGGPPLRPRHCGGCCSVSSADTQPDSAAVSSAVMALRLWLPWLSARSRAVSLSGVWSILPSNVLASHPARDLARRTLATTAGLHATPAVSCSISKHSALHSVATITVNNPRKLNIVNSALLSQLPRICHELSQEATLRAVILTGGETAPGKAPSFIGGADITEMVNLRSYDDAQDFILRVHGACSALRDLPVPVIARVDGFCLGAGLELMASCDLRVATKDSTFGMPEVQVGIPSVVEAALLPSLIGMGRTRRLLYLAEVITASEAERWGLVEKVVADRAALDDAVNAWAMRLINLGPKAIRSQKSLIRRWENCGVDDGIEAGVDSYARAYADGGEEPRQLMSAFINRSR